MEIPEGINIDEEIRTRKLFDLKRCIYGLKISSKNWNSKFYRRDLKKIKVRK